MVVASWQSSNLNVRPVSSTAVGRLKPKHSGVKFVAVVKENCFQSLIRANVLSVKNRKNADSTINH